MKYDLIVIGAGTAGMPCAIQAAARGKRILVVEKDSVIGGTLHLTAGHLSGGGTRRQVEKGISDSPENHYQEVMEISGNTADPAIVRLATQLAPQTIDWLEDLGFQFEPTTPAIINGHVPYKIPRTYWGAADYAGGKILTAGISIFKTLKPIWDKYIENQQITLLLSTKLTRLLFENNRVGGVEVEHDDEAKAHYWSDKVVLATGGYASNPQFFNEVTPGVPRLISTARHTSTGDGIRVALNIGAKLRGAEMHTSTLGGIELEPHSGRTDFWANWARVSNSIDRRPREIYVNEQAERFMNEDEPNPDVREKIVQQQTNRRFWLIFDEKSLNDGACVVPQWTIEQLKAEAQLERAVWQANTLEELASKIGLEANTLHKTIQKFNQAVENQQDKLFGRKHLVYAIDQAPYYALLTYAFSLITFGGLAINQQLAVLDHNQQPIEGLYAAGEIIGASATSGNAFCGGMLLTPALSFGKYLGETL